MPGNLKFKIQNLKSQFKIKNFSRQKRDPAKAGKFWFVILIFTFYILHFKGYALDEAGEELKLYLGETRLISVSSPKRIVIGNPEIADVANVGKNELTLNPKAVGKTTLVIWDNFGEQSYTLKVFSEEIDELKIRVDNILKKLNVPEVYTQAEEEEGKVILLGSVKSQNDRRNITLALGKLKDKIVDLIEVKEEESVVEIDVQVLELSKDATNTLGLTNPFSGTTGYTVTEVGSPGLAAAGTTWSSLFKVLNLQRGAAFSWTLFALIQEGKVKVLSRPRLACQSGKEAELLVGGEKPTFTTTVAATTGAQGTAVSYKEFGIKLKVKPTVVEEERIKLALSVEVSEVGDAEIIGAANAPTAKAYPLSKRTASTELLLEDGQTMAIGGLMKQKSEETITKTPGLGDIPIVGLLFRKKVSKTGGGAGEKGNTELFITLTPKIMREKKAPETIKAEVKPQTISPALKQTQELSPLAGYASIIQKRILDNLTYPPMAREAGFQGAVKLSLRLSYTGKLLEVLVKDSSGYKILDDYAAQAASSPASYPPFPSSIEKKELWIDIPILYRLD